MSNEIELYIHIKKKEMDWLQCNFQFPAQWSIRSDDDELKMNRIVIPIEFEHQTRSWQMSKEVDTQRKKVPTIERSKEKKILTMCHKTELVFRLHLFDTLTLIECNEGCASMKERKNILAAVKKWANIRLVLEKCSRSSSSIYV